ncbi:hypothetical protein SSTU70S_01360 [Stutzerimonas stutzeri]
MVELAIEQRGEPPADRKADAEAAVTARQRGVQLAELLIQRRIGGRPEADTGVDHLELQRQLQRGIAGRTDAQGDTAGAGELDRVVQQMTDDQRELRRIAEQPIGQRGVQLDGKRQSLFAGLRGKALLQGLAPLMQTERRPGGLQLAGTQLAEQQDIVDQAQHVARRLGGDALVFVALFGRLRARQQLQCAHHADHRRAQFVADVGEKFVLEAVAFRQLAVELLKPGARGFEQAGAFVLEHIDAVGQRHRQQHHLQRRADLACVHRQEGVGQIAQHHQRVDLPTDQQRAPGEDEVARHAHATPPRRYARGEHRQGEQQRHDRRQAQRHPIVGQQRQRHHQRTEPHHQPQQAVDPRTVLGRAQEAARELAAEQAGRADQQRRGDVRPPGMVRPEILHRGAVDRQLVETERGDIEDVVQVAAITDADVDEQVVDQHRQQHAIDESQRIDVPGALFDIRMHAPQRQRNLDRTLTLHPQVKALRLVRRQFQLEQVVALPDFPAGPRQRVASGLRGTVSAVAIGTVELDTIQRWIAQLQQPALRLSRVRWSVVQIDADPVGRARIAAVEHGVFVPAKRPGEVGRTDLLDSRRTARVLVDIHERAQRHAAGMLIEFGGSRQQRRQRKQQQKKEPHVASLTQIEDTTNSARG